MAGKRRRDVVVTDEIEPEGGPRSWLPMVESAHSAMIPRGGGQPVTPPRNAGGSPHSRKGQGEGAPPAASSAHPTRTGRRISRGTGTWLVVACAYYAQRRNGRSVPITDPGRRPAGRARCEQLGTGRTGCRRRRSGGWPASIGGRPRVRHCGGRSRIMRPRRTAAYSAPMTPGVLALHDGRLTSIPSFASPACVVALSPCP
jgi:hypothetical protein